MLPQSAVKTREGDVPMRLRLLVRNLPPTMHLPPKCRPPNGVLFGLRVLAETHGPQRTLARLRLGPGNTPGERRKSAPFLPSSYYPRETIRPRRSWPGELAIVKTIAAPGRGATLTLASRRSAAAGRQPVVVFPCGSVGPKL